MTERRERYPLSQFALRLTALAMMGFALGRTGIALRLGERRPHVAAAARIETPTHPPAPAPPSGTLHVVPAVLDRNDIGPGRAASPAAVEPPPVPCRTKVRALVARVKRMHVVTAAGAAYVARMLGELRDGGDASVAAIAEFLHDGDDVDFTHLRGGARLGHRTLRQAMLDTLEKIGGPDAVAVSREQLRATHQPIEMTMVARGLDTEEPGVYDDEILSAVGEILDATDLETAKQSPDVAPLFALLRARADEQTITVLEDAVPQWGEYALMTLAGLPGGAGIPSLTELAANADESVANPTLPFQMLAQATVDYPEAGDALVELARAGRIPDDVWSAMGEALSGRHLQFAANMFDGTPLGDRPADVPRPSPAKSYFIEWLNVRYEQDVVSTSWSDDQIARELAVIDDLLDAAPGPAAVQALQQARASLEGDRET